MERTLEHRNFGLGNRNMVFAGKNALKEGQYSFKSVATNTGHFRSFVNYVKTEHSIQDLKQIERSHVIAFANELKELVNQKELAVSTAQNRLSAVNTVLSIARQDRQCHVSPVREAGLMQRSFVATESKVISSVQHEHAKSAVEPRLAAQMELQRVFGLRFKESALLNAQQALKESEKGKITVTEGTKGGRSREVPIQNQNQIEALKVATSLQGNHHSLVPQSQTLSQYSQQCYQSLAQTGLKGFHGERHAYANARYEALTGQKSPVEANIEHGKAHIAYLASQLNISQAEAKELDKDARLTISAELGHCRIGITNNYLG